MPDFLLFFLRGWLNEQEGGRETARRCAVFKGWVYGEDLKKVELGSTCLKETPESRTMDLSMKKVAVH